MPNKLCPKCSKEIQEEAIKCKHCGEMLTRKCSFCAESIESNATVCPHCKSELVINNNITTPQSPVKQAKPMNLKKMIRNWLIIIVATIIFFAVFITIGLSGGNEITSNGSQSERNDDELSRNARELLESAKQNINNLDSGTSRDQQNYEYMKRELEKAQQLQNQGYDIIVR